MVRYRDEERKLVPFESGTGWRSYVEKGDISDRYYPEDTVEDVDWNIDDSVSADPGMTIAVCGTVTHPADAV